MLSPTKRDVNSLADHVTTFNSTALAVDDTSSAITYSIGWTEVPTGATDGIDTTYHSVQSAGAKATFIFNGTGIEVYGYPGSFVNSTVVQLPPLLQFTISGLIPVVIRPVAPVGRVGNVYATLTYVSPPLAAGVHMLTITCLDDSLSYFGLNYLVYSPTIPLVDMPSITSAIHSSTPLPSAAAGDSSTTGSGKSSSVGAIVGGTIGGVIFLVLLVILGLWYRRRHRRPSRSAWVQLFDNRPDRPVAAVPDSDVQKGATSEYGDSKGIPLSNLTDLPRKT